MEKRCPLCLEHKEIVTSHLISGGVYEYCRPDPGDHPIKITSKYLMQSDRELKYPLLCSDCEQSLNRNGETWLLPLLAQYDGPFPFHDLLTRGPVAVAWDKNIGYNSAENPAIRRNDLAHFAMGIFWKAAVHSWRGGRTKPLIDLGPYRERVRLFLRGEANFPNHMSLTVCVMPPPVKMIDFEFPYRGSERQWHNFHFSVPGIRFILCVGKGMKSNKRLSCFVTNPLHPILVTDFSPLIMSLIAGALRSPRNFEMFRALGERTKID